MTLSSGLIELLDRISPVLVLVVLALSAVMLARLTQWSPVGRLRQRLVLGVPWGTLVVVAGLAGVYYGVQGGGGPGGPVATGFRSWSLWYPEGLVLSSFAHASNGHLLSNATATLAFAPLVEYVWGHYSATDRTNWLGRPVVRIGGFVFAVVGVGLAGSLFVPGAVIGFSGVVFAFAGVAVVTVPLALVFAMLGLQVLRLVQSAFEAPLVLARAQETFVSPSWADTAVQGHLFGLLIGVTVGIVLVRRQDRSPDLRYVWFAALAFGVTRGLYAVFWYQGTDSFLLFRGLGTAGVFVLAGIIAGAVVSTERSIVPRVEITSRELSVGVVLAVLFVLALVAVPYNLVTVGPGETPAAGVEIRDYTVTYAEDVENQYIASAGSSLLGTASSVTVSGVIVTSDQRNVWELAASRAELASRGQTIVPVGGPGWRETVVVNRTAWEFVGGNQTYTVFGHRTGTDERQQLFAAPQANSSVTVDNKTIGIRPTEAFYSVVVYQNGTDRGSVQIPSGNETVTLAGLSFERDDQVLIASQDGTRIPIARYRLDDSR